MFDDIRIWTFVGFSILLFVLVLMEHVSKMHVFAIDEFSVNKDFYIFMGSVLGGNVLMRQVENVTKYFKNKKQLLPKKPTGNRTIDIAMGDPTTIRLPCNDAPLECPRKQDPSYRGD